MVERSSVCPRTNTMTPAGPLHPDSSAQTVLLYSWRFSRYSAPICWLLHGHMTSNNETVSRQMPWAGNTAKAMTSNGKQFTVTRSTVHCYPVNSSLLTAVARDGWNLSAVFKFCFWSLGEQWILFPSNLNVSLDILGKQNSLFPLGPVIKCLMPLHLHVVKTVTSKRVTLGYCCDVWLADFISCETWI